MGTTTNQCTQTDALREKVIVNFLRRCQSHQKNKENKRKQLHIYQNTEVNHNYQRMHSKRRRINNTKALLNVNKMNIKTC